MLRDAKPVALPRRLMKRHADNPALNDAKRLPALLDLADKADEANDRNGSSDAARQPEHLVRQTLGVPRLETYYALLLMDGDRMGQILSGDVDWAITYRESFHPQVREGFDKQAQGQAALKAYGEQKRALSPNRHLAISGALNDFSLHVVRHVVEEAVSYTHLRAHET